MFIGTRYFDDSWLGSGSGERKLTHVMDFIDSAIYLKEKGLAPKLGALGINESGSVTALAASFSEPLLFDCTVAHVRKLST
jgi:protease II